MNRAIDRPSPTVNSNTDHHTGKAYFVDDKADFSLKGLDPDPGHEFGDVETQLSGPNLGFVDSYAAQKANDPGRIMECFSPEQLPVLNQLAGEFAICDNWFSSLPGPTWPNRFFLMAASSGGLTKSPSTADIIKATALEGYAFEHGNIFDALEKKNIPWSIVEGDLFPVSFALKGMDAHALNGRFVDIGDFEKRISAPGFNDKFIFIEPQYGSHKFDITGPGDFSGGNSMHPLDDIRKGEQLIKQVYEAIRSVPAVWEQSVLLITFDEHGGFYDHVQPGSAIPPGDKPVNAANGQAPFDFSRLGVRVPALIVSPLIEKGIVDHRIYDHSSALATLERIFGVDPLTKRDAAANDFSDLFTLKQARTDTPLVLNNPATTAPLVALASVPLDTADTLKSELALLEPVPGAEKIASEPEVSGPQVGFAYVGLMRALSNSGSPAESDAWKQEFSNIENRRDAARFMARAKLKIHYNEYVPCLSLSKPKIPGKKAPPDDPGYDILISYLTLRKAIGILGMSLPFVLFAGSSLLSQCICFEESISAYYYTKMGGVLVGTLCSLGIFLLTYNGYDRQDRIFSKSAGVFAVLIALFPYKGPSVFSACDILRERAGSFSTTLHNISCVLFLLILAYMSLFLFTKTSGTVTPHKRIRNRIYRICGGFMFGSILLLGICYEGWLKGLDPYRPILILEALSLIAFGISWLTKGEAILRD